MKKKSLILFFTGILIVSFPCFSQNLTCEGLKSEALKLESVQEAINFISSKVDSISDLSEKRSTLYFLGTLQDQSAMYSKASLSYVKAAGIAAKDAKNMPKVTSEELVLCAVRSALNAGEHENAESYLNSAVRSSKNPEIQARVNLYSVWVSLCRAQNIESTKDSIALLKAYAVMDSMEYVMPSVLLTLWYLTDEKEYAQLLKKKYPSSPECGIVDGNVQIMTTPFWFFVPRMDHGIEESVPKVSVDISSSKASESSSKSSKIKCQQLGLFKEKANADDLIKRAKAEGFEAYSYTEKRSSGTTYYIVVVDENADETMGLKLRDKGFECYPVVE